LIFEYFSKIFYENSILFKIGQEQWVLHMKTSTHFFIISLSFLLRMRNASDKICRENRFVFNKFFPPENRAVSEIMWKNMVESEKQATTARRMLFAFCISKATVNQNMYYVLLFHSNNNSTNTPKSKYNYIASLVTLTNDIKYVRSRARLIPSCRFSDWFANMATSVWRVFRFCNYSYLCFNIYVDSLRQATIPIVKDSSIYFNTQSLGASFPLCYKQLGSGWGTSKHNCLVSYFIMLTATCFSHCGPSSGHKKCI